MCTLQDNHRLFVARILQRVLLMITLMGVYGCSENKRPDAAPDLPSATAELSEKNRKLLRYDLQKFAMLYHEFNSERGRAPSTLAELGSFTPDDTLGINPPDTYDAPRAFEMIRNGRFIIIWDAVLLLDGDENAKYVLGYEPHTSENGGLVMRGGGLVLHLTADEFNAMPRIKTRAN